ncbi:type II toxin-antitoxin system YafQ family toxin [Bifidobacterium cebidarum]|uniref:Addiction module toxin RelE n=1 Tax=Bifidobacterium cebidarum TaxID=2650773 RepID=A0A6I1GGV9_9BIFI|nr:type II toxin-antitoxin system YafQ family toxin [Bifidobacterium cebidarum]KAB7788599.1 addiction module toxin RelE [Bifidobacterium cebidarum]
MPSRIQRITTIRAFDQDVKTLKKKHVDVKRMLPAIHAIVDGDQDLLAMKYRDHALTGNWNGYRELHIEGDWLLVYFIDGDGLVLVLTRTSTHDELYSGKTTRKLIKTYKDAMRRDF